MTVKIISGLFNISCRSELSSGRQSILAQQRNSPLSELWNFTIRNTAKTKLSELVKWL